MNLTSNPYLKNPKLRAMTHGNTTQRSDSVKQVYDAMASMGANSDKVKALYKKSHHAYDVSERINRKYDNFQADNVFGCTTRELIFKDIEVLERTLMVH